LFHFCALRVRHLKHN